MNKPERIVTDEVRYEVSDHIATITLNAPERMNTISGPMLARLSRAADRGGRGPRRALHHPDRHRPGVLRRPRPHAGDARHRHRRIGSGAGATDSTCATRRRPCCINLDTPTICASTAARPATASTPRSAATSASWRSRAKLAPAFAKRGILPESGGTWLLPRLVGWAKAAEIIFTGRTLSADGVPRAGSRQRGGARRRADAGAARATGGGDRGQRAARGRGPPSG